VPGAWSRACSRRSTPPGAGRPPCTPTGCNPFAELADTGVALALGSDAPVTPLDPWGGVHAAVDHRTPGSGLRPFDAFDAATHGGWYAARLEHPAGPLAVGAPADLALWATGSTLSAVLSGRERPPCRLLVVAGEPC
jgi:predicted amidohydrolase YtcJ